MFNSWSGNIAFAFGVHDHCIYNLLSNLLNKHVKALLQIAYLCGFPVKSVAKSAHLTKISKTTIGCQATNITVTSWWARWRLKSPGSHLFPQTFIQAKIKENNKAPRHRPVCGEFTADQIIPRTNGQ